MLSKTSGGLRLRALGLLVAVLALVGCGEASSIVQPRDGRAGLWLTGTVAGRHVAVSDGSPALILGDCDPAGGPSQDVCFVGRGIDGTVIAVLVRNPAALEAGSVLRVESAGCRTAQQCADEREVAVIDVRVGESRLARVTEGTLTLRVVEVGERYAGTLRLAWRDGRLSGEFDVIPRRE